MGGGRRTGRRGFAPPKDRVLSQTLSFLPPGELRKPAPLLSAALKALQIVTRNRCESNRII
jgi:hypothetical protein